MSDEEKQGRRGRPSIYNRIPKEKLIGAYRRFKTVRAAAKALGISHVTLLRVLKENKVDMLDNREAKQVAMRSSRHTGSFARWLEAHEGEVLPRDMERLRIMSGCSPNSISSYFYRRRRNMKQLIRSIPDLRRYAVVLQDTFGDTYETKDFAQYEYIIDKFSLEVKILVKRKRGNTLIFEIPDVRRFKKAVIASGPLQESSLPQETPSSSHPDQDIPEPLLHNDTEYFQATFPDSLRRSLDCEYSRQERTCEEAESEPDEPDSQSPSPAEEQSPLQTEDHHQTEPERPE